MCSVGLDQDAMDAIVPSVPGCSSWGIEEVFEGSEYVSGTDGSTVDSYPLYRLFHVDFDQD